MADASLNPQNDSVGLRLRGQFLSTSMVKLRGFPCFRCIAWVANIIWICFDGDFCGFCHHGLGNIFSTTLSKSQFCDYVSTPSLHHFVQLVGSGS